MKAKFESIIQSEVPVLIDFYAEWCQPCKLQSVVMEEIAPMFKDKIRFIKINIEKNNNIAGKYNVQSIPTLMLFKKGNLIWRKTGYNSRDILANSLIEALENKS